MKILLDTANIDDIKYFSEYYPIAGVTTNPTILSREGGDIITLLKMIRSIIGISAELHIQTTQTKCDRIVTEAFAVNELLGDNTYIKIPVCDEGIKATRILSSKGFSVTETAIFTAAQALLAAQAGACYVAPYVSRLESIAADGIGTVADIATVLADSGSTTKILAASFKTVKQVVDTALAGAHSATVSPSVLRLMSQHPMTDKAVTGFSDDWKSTFGDKSLLDIMKY